MTEATGLFTKEHTSNLTWLLSIKKAVVPGGGKVMPSYFGTCSKRIGLFSDLNKTAVSSLQISAKTLSDIRHKSKMERHQEEEFLSLISAKCT